MKSVRKMGGHLGSKRQVYPTYEEAENSLDLEAQIVVLKETIKTKDAIIGVLDKKIEELQAELKSIDFRWE